MCIIVCKRSATAGAVPAPGQLVLGELAVNLTDGLVFLKRADGSIVAIGNAPGTVPYDLTWMFPGMPAASAVLFRCPLARAVTFPPTMAGSQGVAGTAATAATIFRLRRNGTQFGTMRFAAGAKVATFTSASGAAFAVGDVLTITAPTTADATLADVAGTLVGLR